MPHVDEGSPLVTVWRHECEKLAKDLEEAQQEISKLRETLDWGETLVGGFMIGEPPSKEQVWAWLELTKRTLWPQPPKWPPK